MDLAGNIETECSFYAVERVSNWVMTSLLTVVNDIIWSVTYFHLYFIVTFCLFFRKTLQQLSWFLVPFIVSILKYRPTKRWLCLSCHLWQSNPGTYTRRLVSCEHSPSMPVQVTPKCCVFHFPKTIHIFWRQACRYLNELVVKSKTRKARIPTENKRKQFYSCIGIQIVSQIIMVILS